MEAFPPRLTHEAGLRQQAALAGILLAALLCAPGCTLDQCWMTKDASSANGRPCEVATSWLNRVQYTPDVANDGVPTPGLVCRVYLFDQAETHPLVGDGSVTITLFDDTHGPATQPLEQWYIDPATLKKFLKKDMVGPGYTLFLPWKSCRPEVVKTHLTCKYEPATGSPIYGPVTPLTLEHTPPPAGAAVAAAAPPQQLTMPTPVR
jgi:hypothetical protein